MLRDPHAITEYKMNQGPSLTTSAGGQTSFVVNISITRTFPLHVDGQYYAGKIFFTSGKFAWCPAIHKMPDN